MTSSKSSGNRAKIKIKNESIFNEHRNKRFKNDGFGVKNFYNLNKSRIYNLEHRKKPAELVRKDLISAMKLPDHENLNKEDYYLILDPWRQEWEKGVQVPVNPESLPQSSVTLVDDKSMPSCSENKCPSKNVFEIPKKFVKYENSKEQQISTYELDLQDICWLKSLKASELNIEINENFLEEVINAFEQQCAQNIKARQVGIEYDDHIVCDVCQSPDSEEDNEMVFCDLCNICVHQACYGILEIPEGDWLCSACKDFGCKKNVLCALCSNVGGALKPTTKPNQWAHVSCVYWIPEAIFLDLNLLEPVDIKQIPSWRWNLVCSLCNVKKGAPIMCDEKNCKNSYHVTCAFQHNLKMKIVLNDSKSNIKLKAYCLEHSKATKDTRDAKSKEIDFYVSSIKTKNDSLQKNLNPQYEFWKYLDVNKVFQEFSKKYLSEGDDNSCKLVTDYLFTHKSLQQIIDLIYQYWKLKRISNYGNSLIKLTFAQKFKEQMKIHKNQILQLRYQLERLRTLSYMLCRREKIKNNWLNVQKDIISNTFKLINELNFQPDQLETDHFSFSPNKDTTAKCDDLLSRTINHHNIYSNSPMPYQNSQTNSNVSLNSHSYSSPLKSHHSSCISDEEHVYQTCPNTPSSINKVPLRVLNSISMKRKRIKSDRCVTNDLIKDLTRLSLPNEQQNKSINPYAKYYLNTTPKRKKIDYLQNKCDISVTDSLQNSQSLSTNTDYHCTSPRTPSSCQNKIDLRTSRKSSSTIKPSLNSPKNSEQKSSNNNKIPKKVLKFDNLITEDVKAVEPSKYYFRSSNGSTNSGELNQENLNDAISSDGQSFNLRHRKCSTLNQKENGHFDSKQQQNVSLCTSFKTTGNNADSISKPRTRFNKASSSKLNTSHNDDVVLSQMELNCHDTPIRLLECNHTDTADLYNKNLQDARYKFRKCNSCPNRRSSSRSRLNSNCF